MEATNLAVLHRGPKDHINMRILQTALSGILLVFGLRARMKDPYVHVVLGALTTALQTRLPILRAQNVYQESPWPTIMGYFQSSMSYFGV